jgi:hypothetical protein
MAFQDMIRNSFIAVKQGAEAAAAIKGMWDVGRTVYSGVQAALPYAEAAIAFIP